MKAIIDSLEEVPETLRTEYESKDGRYVLKLDGDMPGFVSSEEHAGVKTRLIEFRDNNIKMLREQSYSSNAVNC